jgi:hypothetical protein
MQEAKELNQATEQYHAQPLEDNLYEWHFTIRGGLLENADHLWSSTLHGNKKLMDCEVSIFMVSLTPTLYAMYATPLPPRRAARHRTSTEY